MVVNNLIDYLSDSSPSQINLDNALLNINNRYWFKKLKLI